MSNGPIDIVGIGASAGGIEAFRGFFEHMPAESGLGFVVVLHLAANRESMLAQIIGRWTTMAVRQAEDGAAVLPDQVLVVPPGTVATLRDGALRLRRLDPDAPRESRPIDTFFDSLAAEAGERAVGIVLSGTGHDGALGLKAIRARGGLTLAQGTDGSEPQHHGMPDSAAATGAVDLHIPVEEMPAAITARRGTRAAQGEAGGEAGGEDGGEAGADGDEDADSGHGDLGDGDSGHGDSGHGDSGHEDLGHAEAERDEARAVRLAICGILRARLGHDFSRYKEQSFMRRVRRRMQVLGLAGLDQYVERLKRDRDQATALFRDLLIGVTSFFRDADAFEVLERDVLPRLFEGKTAADTLRVWVPGCATGEEAYSLAMLLREQMDRHLDGPAVQVFASDIDEVAIGVARTGRYPSTLVDGLSAERRERFFTGGHNSMTVTREVRDLCTFSVHSLIRDPPFSRIDLVSCRNLLIYMDAALQSDVLPIFHYALTPGGFLVLGNSESLNGNEAMFTAFDKSRRIFVRRDGYAEPPRLAYTPGRDASPAGRVSFAREGEPPGSRKSAIAAASRRVLERYASSFVVVDAQGEVAHFSSHTGPYLEPASGAPTANLFDLARRGWSAELRAVLRQCVEAGAPVERERAFSTPDGAASARVRLVAEPLPSSEAKPLYLIVFVEVEPAGGLARVPPLLPQGADAVIAHVEQENRELREQLQSIAEEHGTALEELRSSNEELQSVNEELQSAIEELQTSKEEIQSVNEELSTVNLQLSGKVDQLDRANSDLKNLFESTKVATVFLGPHLVIRSFTPEIATLYNLIPSDVGRPLTDIAGRIAYETLREDVGLVLDTLTPLERRVARTDGSAHYLVRILPYRSPDNAVDGSLLTFVDVTSLVQAEAHQRLLIDELNHRVKNMLTVVISLATATLRRSESLPEFSDMFMGRVHALSAAYTLLSREGWEKVALHEMMAQELQPFLSDERHNVVIEGPPVMLEPRRALALGMALHELATNAVKHGALSVPEGTVQVTWTIEGTARDGKQIALEWRERDGPAVTPPQRRGFGTIMIERGLAHDLGGSVTLEFPADGVRARLLAPLLDPAAAPAMATQDA